MSEQANFSELRSKISNWDLDAEQMLIDKINIFTNSYKTDFSVFTKNMENLQNNLSSIEVSHYQAISNLKDISQNRFIEEKVEENADSVSEGSGVEVESGKEFFLDNNEKMKKTAEISMKNMEEINKLKEKNKEQIEDDTVSVASKNLVLENSKRPGSLPFIIGTDDFMRDKRIGLTNEADEEDNQNENDEPEIDKDILSDMIVTAKTQKRWDKVEQKRKIQKAKEEKLKIQKEQNNANTNIPETNNDFDEEVKEQIKVPTENENVEINKENNNNANNNGDNLVISTGKGAGVPPPPPPPPVPVFNPDNLKLKKKIENKESGNNNININNINNNQNEKTNINNNITNNLSNMLANNSNANNNIKSFKPKINQSMNLLLMQGLNNIVAGDDDDDLGGGIFSIKNRFFPKLNNNLNIVQSQNPTIIPQSDIMPNNNNMKTNAAKLNNIFEKIGVFEDEKGEVEEEQKVEEKKNEEQKNNNEQIEEVQKENKNIFENQEKSNFPAKQNKLFNKLFDEEEKNNTENAEPKKPQVNFETKKKMTLFFADDDE